MLRIFLIYAKQRRNIPAGFCGGHGLIVNFAENKFLRPENKQKAMDTAKAKVIAERVERLREWMRREGLGAVIIPSTDPHGSEYTPQRWESRAYISGFDGSAGTAVVTLGTAALWTDSRYYLYAADVLEGTPFVLMRDGLPDTPSIGEWLCAELGAGDTVGADAAVMTPAGAEALRSALRGHGIALRLTDDPFDSVWEGRPAVPHCAVEVQPLEYAGESCRSKVARLLSAAAARGADALLLTALDDIAWTLNLRGQDVEYNPVFVAYLLLTARGSVLLTPAERLTPDVRRYLESENIATAPYDGLSDALRRLDPHITMLPDKVNCRVAELFAPGRRIFAPSPAESMKAVKNDAEIAGFHSAMLRDGVAMVRFLSRLDDAVARGITEMGVDEMLTSLRARDESFRGLSFATIAAAGAHAAIVHYEATPATDVTLPRRGFLLLDSGAQYVDGTTDITRTIPLGPLTEEERRVYTLVLKGHIALSRCVFPDGASGTQIDLAARYAMWRERMNYGHGTGHGVGSRLNVHEGPHQIRMNYMPAPLREGMTVTDEPGLYLAGRFGVRTENTLLIAPAGESEFGRFLQFEPLTLCPIATTPIVMSMLSADEKAWLNDYHATVRVRLAPLLSAPEDAAALSWLKAATEPLP